MSEQIIICATTGSKSQTSRNQITPYVRRLFQGKIFGTCHLLVGPSSHDTRTPEKHLMAVSQAVHVAQTATRVSLIFVIPENYETVHLTSLDTSVGPGNIYVKILHLKDVKEGKLGTEE